MNVHFWIYIVSNMRQSQTKYQDMRQSEAKYEDMRQSQRSYGDDIFIYIL